LQANFSSFKTADDTTLYTALDAALEAAFRKAL
jgi:hypothetical protein